MLITPSSTRSRAIRTTAAIPTTIFPSSTSAQTTMPTAPAIPTAIFPSTTLISATLVATAATTRHPRSTIGGNSTSALYITIQRGWSPWHGNISIPNTFALKVLFKLFALLDAV